MPQVEVNVSVVIDGVEHGHRTPHIAWNVGPVSEQHLPGPLGARYMIQLIDTQQVKVNIAPVDKKGAPAQVQDVTFTSSDGTVAAVTQDEADPNSATVVAGLPGTCQIQVTADADLGDGVTTITSALDVTVVGGQAVGLAINAGAPEEQP
jgi:hypothetical protein